MKDLAKTSAGVVVGVLLGATGVAVVQPEPVAVDKAELLDAKNDKSAILEQYVYAKIRLNEVPELDLSTASSEELVAAYVAIANEKGATEKENLFVGLSDKAKQDGVSCKK